MTAFPMIALLAEDVSRHLSLSLWMTNVGNSEVDMNACCHISPAKLQGRTVRVHWMISHNRGCLRLASPQYLVLFVASCVGIRNIDRLWSATTKTQTKTTEAIASEHQFFCVVEIRELYLISD